jgi:hypothetical protein
MALTTIPAAGAKLRGTVLSSLITEVRPVAAYKTATETVNNSNVLQNDDTLFVPVTANAVYEARGRFLYNGNSTADLKLGWTFPTGLTMSYTILGVFVATPTVFSTSDFSQTSNPALEGAGADRTAIMWGLVTVSSTAGTLQLQWAQNAANASNTNMLAGSYLILTPIA